MSYSGSCHCGAVTFTVEGDLPTEAISCNCSHCRRKGFLFTFVPEAAFTLTGGQDALKPYLFNKHRIEHQFCTRCGTQGFAAAAGPDGTPMRAVNLRCVPELDLGSLELKMYDGAAA